MARIKVTTTTDQLDAIWRAVHTARSTAKLVKVDRAAIVNLLADYQNLVALRGDETGA